MTPSDISHWLRSVLGSLEAGRERNSQSPEALEAACSYLSRLSPEQLVTLQTTVLQALCKVDDLGVWLTGLSFLLEENPATSRTAEIAIELHVAMGQISSAIETVMHRDPELRAKAFAVMRYMTADAERFKATRERVFIEAMRKSEERFGKVPGVELCPEHMQAKEKKP